MYQLISCILQFLHRDFSLWVTIKAEVYKPYVATTLGDLKAYPNCGYASNNAIYSSSGVE